MVGLRAPGNENEFDPPAFLSPTAGEEEEDEEYEAVGEQRVS